MSEICGACEKCFIHPVCDKTIKLYGPECMKVLKELHDRGFEKQD
jgi:hypothetical protein